MHRPDQRSHPRAGHSDLSQHRPQKQRSSRMQQNIRGVITRRAIRSPEPPLHPEGRRGQGRVIIHLLLAARIPDQPRSDLHDSPSRKTGALRDERVLREKGVVVVNISPRRRGDVNEIAAKSTSALMTSFSISSSELDASRGLGVLVLIHPSCKTSDLTLSPQKMEGSEQWNHLQSRDFMFTYASNHLHT